METSFVMAEIFTPNNFVESSKPIIFIGGPAKGAGGWQYDAVDILSKKEKDVLIALPFKKINRMLNASIVNNTAKSFSGQREWELYYQDVASRKGCILFWFPPEREHNCDKSYGLISSGEVSYWSGVYQFDKNVNFCIGGNGNFNEWDTFLRDFSKRIPDKTVFNSLEETCDEALRIAYKI